MLGHLGAMLGPAWGPSWAILGLCWGRCFARRAKNTVNYEVFFDYAWSAVGARSPIAKANGLRPGALPVDRACWPDLSAYARQPARGPTMLAHLVAGNVGPASSYVGLSSRVCGPILRPMSADLEAYVGPC